MDGAPACPFVAFGDDRDGRSTSPDHRHRCFAESPPAPRAVAHQEAYCLSSAFPVCPTFQDWARREAAHARGGGERPETAPTAVPSSSPRADPDDVRDIDQPRRPPDDIPVTRNPPRDWAAPPPWAVGAAAGAAGRATGPPAGSPGAVGHGPGRHGLSEGSVCGGPRARRQRRGSPGRRTGSVVGSGRLALVGFGGRVRIGRCRRGPGRAGQPAGVPGGCSWKRQRGQ